MKVNNIIPCIKVIQSNDFSGCDMYIEEGEALEIVVNDKIIKGKFLFIELSKYEEFDDIIHILTEEDERIEISTGEITKFL